uniref:Uncharacterized protein n=1 Tax=Rhizophora mucronata TaxID=61149 RepID=A0A2P2MKP3_RHIMU
MCHPVRDLLSYNGFTSHFFFTAAKDKEECPNFCVNRSHFDFKKRCFSPSRAKKEQDRLRKNRFLGLWVRLTYSCFLVERKAAFRYEKGSFPTITKLRKEKSILLVRGG